MCGIEGIATEEQERMRGERQTERDREGRRDAETGPRETEMERQAERQRGTERW